MKKGMIVLAAAALFVGFAVPALATHDKGEVKEIIIRIQTDEGEKYYRVGEDVELINIRPGKVVHFDYADDVVESITTEEPKEAKPAEGE